MNRLSRYSVPFQAFFVYFSVFSVPIKRIFVSNFIQIPSNLSIEILKKCGIYLIDFAEDIKCIKDIRNPADHGTIVNCTHAEFCSDVLVKVYNILADFLDRYPRNILKRASTLLRKFFRISK
jgi:hypothetical protein